MDGHQISPSVAGQGDDAVADGGRDACSFSGLGETKTLGVPPP